MSEAQYLTRPAAAALCQCSEDTIRKYDRDGKLSNRRLREIDGVNKVEVAVADLVTAGLLDPLVLAGGSVTEIAGRGQAQRDLAATRQQLAVASARCESLTDQLARTEDEITFLRGMLVKAGAA